MRKIFLAALAICLLAVGSVASAQPNYNFIQVTDLAPKAFVDRMGNGNVYQNLLKQGTVVAFTAPAHHPELNDTQNFPGFEVYRSLFGIQGSETPNGEIHFFVNSAGNVYIVRIINTGDDQLSGIVLIMLMEALGLNQQEIAPLLQTQSATAETWCAAANRKILRVVTDQAGNNIMFFGATN